MGNEAKRMTCNIKKNEFKGICVLPPYPRTMGTEVPEYAKPHTYELPEIAFTKQYQDSCTAVALKTTIEANTEEIFLVGYDGYMGEILSDKEMDLSNENRTLFENYINFTGKKLQSLTPTLYKSLIAKSVYPNFRKRMKSEIAMHFLVSLLSLHCVLVKRRCQRSTLLHNFPLPHEAT